MARCIWCKNPDPERSFEEIVPAALGCPPELTFRDGEVCKTNNNGNGHLDQAVVDALDIAAFHVGLVRRGGRPPQIENRGNLYADVDPVEGRRIFVNLGKTPVLLPNGRRLAPRHGRPRDVSAELRIDGGSIQTVIRDAPKFIRGVHKIGFEVLAKHLGPDKVASDDSYDAVRRFVLEGRGDRSILISGAASASEIHIGFFDKGNGRFLVYFTLAGFAFLVDLTPEQELILPVAMDLLRRVGREGWCWYPVRLCPIKPRDAA